MRLAKIIVIKDASGSMSRLKNRKGYEIYCSLKDNLSLLYRDKLLPTNIILHTTKVKHCVTPVLPSIEEEFFYLGYGGGTYISPALACCREIFVEKNKDIDYYIFHCTDGDCWREDIDLAIEEMKKIANKAQLYIYNEVKFNTYTSCLTEVISSNQIENLVITPKVTRMDADMAKNFFLKTIVSKRCNNNL